VPEDRPIQPTPSAGQPFTFGGVARFAHASLGRLLLASLIFGVLTGLAIMWLAALGWAPVIDEVVAKLPGNGGIQNGALQWPERSGRLLGANSFLSLEVVLQNAPRDSASADVSIEAHVTYLVVRSLFGAATIPYPRLLNLALDRATTVPAWGAWRAPLLVGLVPATAFILLLTWWLVAIPYSFLALATAGVFRRDLNFLSAWKLSVAAQLPGSLLMSFAVGLYASGQVGVLFIGVMLAAHFIPTGLYLLISPVLVAKRGRRISDQDNPFDPADRKASRAKNPFARLGS
jgi:hypothetical protein